MKHPARNAAKKNPFTSNNLLTASADAAAPKARPAKRLTADVARRRKARKTATPERKQALSAAVLETLENRQFLSASMGVANGVLQLAADSQTPSRLVVHLSRDGRQVVASINGKDESFDLKNIRGISVVGSEKADEIRVSTRITVPATIEGGAGDDRIYGGGGNDSIDAGDGNDFVNGRGGNDSISGGNGNDTLVGGTGNDTIDGGAGNDRVYGRDGNDSIAGDTGVDTLWGGNGNDTLDGSAGADVINPQAGTNRIVRGPQDKVRARRRDVVVTASNGVGDANGSSQDGSAGGTSSTPGNGGSSGSNAGGTTPSGSTSGTGSGTSTTGGSGSSGSTGGANSGSTGNKNPGSGGNTGSGGSNSSSGGTANSGSTGNNGGTSSTPRSDPGVGGTSSNNGSSSSVDPIGAAGNIGIDRTTGKLKADIQFIQATGMAGHAVHVNGLGSTLSAGDALNAIYTWDFGDPGSRFNTLVGWNAGHVYDNPGTYTVTLTVTDISGNTSKATGKVTIAANTRNTIYVDLNGSDANTGATPATAVASFDRAAELATDNTTILFHNGQTFDTAAGWYMNVSNVTLTSYGRGATAVLRKGKDQSVAYYILDVGPKAQNVVVENLQFNSMWPIEQFGDQKTGADGIYVSGDNFTARNCQFANLDDAINTAGRPTGVIVQDNYFAPSIRGCCIWAEGYDYVVIGNTFTNSTQEHLIRAADSGVTRMLVENNSFSRPNNNKGSLELRTAQWFYVRGNRIDGGTLRMGLPNAAAPASQAVAYGVVEDNETFKIFVNFRPGASHIILRDNVFHYDDGIVIDVETKFADVPRLTQDLRFDHNTVMSDSNQAIFLQLDGPAKDISVTNNLMVAPHLTWVGNNVGAVYIAGTDLSSFTTIADNIWPQEPSTASQAGINYMYGQLWDIQSGYISNLQWQSYSKVHNEQYDNADLSGDRYSITLNGVTAGATSDQFDPNAYKLAVSQAA